MIKAKDYKYRSTKVTSEDIVFAMVVKEPHWRERPRDICKDLPVGAITWFALSYTDVDKKGNLYFPEEASVCPENNRHGVNFEPSCFEILHTTKQKIRRK